MRPERSRRLLDGSYWVGERLAAGEYPGAATPAEAELKLVRFAGIDTFVDLTDEADGPPPYEQRLAPGVRRVSMPIPDFTAPDERTIATILDRIDAELAGGRTVYVHCWGGIGRTGTVIGCWLVRHGATGREALERIAELRAGTPDAERRSPETEEQRARVLGWSRGR